MKTVTMHGQPVGVGGRELKAGEKAPFFTLTGKDLQPVTLEQFKGKVVIIACVPSVDTPVCDLETRRFNREAAQLSDDIVIVTVSKDLPFAQARFCAANHIDRVAVASDYKDLGFARDYGVLLKDLGLLTRAVFIVDKEGIIKYIQFVPEVTHEPDYGAVIAEAKKLI